MISSAVHAPLLINRINSIFKTIIFTNTVARLLKLVLRYIPCASNSNSPIMDMINSDNVTGLYVILCVVWGLVTMVKVIMTV